MNDWASKRKLIYALIAIGILIILIVVPSFLIFYNAPTCFDNKMNGDEAGIDCGGSCKKLCQSAFLPPRIEWGGAKIEQVAPSIYNVASYIVNPNINGGAKNVPYKVSLFDSNGLFILEKKGNMTLYPRRNTLAFIPAINTGSRIPTKASFEFISSPEWFKSTDRLGSISVTDKKYNESDNSSTLNISFSNKNLIPYNNITVAAILYDSNGNVIGFSQTKLDEIPAKNTVISAPFTWPISHNGSVASIEVLPVTDPISDY